MGVVFFVCGDFFWEQKYARYKNQGILIKTISVNCNVNSCQFEVKFCFWVIRMQRRCIGDPKQNLVNSGGRDWANWANWSDWANWSNWWELV